MNSVETESTASRWLRENSSSQAHKLQQHEERNIFFFPSLIYTCNKFQQEYSGYTENSF